MMTAAQTESLSTEGVRSLEVRWIFSGELAGVVDGWFARFPTETTVLEDAYLLDPHLPGLSVKVREGRALEVKAYRGSPGCLEVAGRARGRLEAWQKWSFPHGPAGLGGGGSAGWRAVSKRRRISRFSLAGGPAKAGDRGSDEGPGCAVELTDVHVGGEAWWTLGFEATGPRDVLRSELETAAALVFAMALPGGLELDIDDSRSYGQWLQRAAAGTGIGRPQVLGLSPNLEAIRWPMLERTPPHIREG
jgi:hypothetical protein